MITMIQVRDGLGFKQDAQENKVQKGQLQFMEYAFASADENKIENLLH
jgi:hypothetical protein